MKIANVEAIPFIAARSGSTTGTAGSPAVLQAGFSAYRWAEHYPVLYSTRFETVLVRVTLDSGLTGWGESQAPVAPQVVTAIVEHILRPILEGVAFEGSIEEIVSLWWRMYSAMRVRGQTGGFMLDAIAGVDLALWDLAGKLTNRRVVDLLSETLPENKVPAYLSGLPGGVPANVQPWLDQGFSRVKVFHDSSNDELQARIDGVSEILGSTSNVAVDALWRLNPRSAPAFTAKLEERKVLWLEAPLSPEDATEHAALACQTSVPLAIGESYRTLFELQPFFRNNAMQIVQPDLGRTGITEGLRIAREALERGLTVIPHVSIALGPQIAAAIHFAASLPNCPMLEFNPSVIETANRYLVSPLRVEQACYQLPDEPGLGVQVISS